MKHGSDYSMPKQYPNKTSGSSIQRTSGAKVTTHLTTNENPNDGMKPNSVKSPQHKYSSY